MFFVLLWPAPLRAQATERSSPARPGERIARFLGERTYTRACAACHGVAGDGRGPAARYLDPRPRDFTSGTFKFRSTPDGELPTDDDLYRTVSQGVPRTMMPAWRDLLTDREIMDVVSYIKTFSDKFEHSGPGTPITIPEEPEATSETVAEGKNLYIIMQCWKCHGPAGKGDGKSANTLVDDWARRIKPFDFTSGNYKAGSDKRSVYKTLYTGLNGSPMPAYAGAMLFAEISAESFSTYAEAYAESELEALRAYLAAQPTAAELDEMSEAELEDLVGRRTWSLIHFVDSLSRRKGILHQLFIEDPELVR